MSGVKHRAPPCFVNDDQLLAWRNMNHYVGQKEPSGFCTDCLPDYQARMCAAGRCKYPATVFVMLPQGGVEGRRKCA